MFPVTSSHMSTGSSNALKHGRHGRHGVRFSGELRRALLGSAESCSWQEQQEHCESRAAGPREQRTEIGQSKKGCVWRGWRRRRKIEVGIGRYEWFGEKTPKRNESLIDDEVFALRFWLVEFEHRNMPRWIRWSFKFSSSFV